MPSIGTTGGSSRRLGDCTVTSESPKKGVVVDYPRTHPRTSGRRTAAGALLDVDVNDESESPRATRVCTAR
ncbi:MAG: hypothetical protein H0U30_08240 [Actinobacteria bacterium]|nr:hypothetical protein [Actinomycetota bacterium]